MSDSGELMNAIVNGDANQIQTTLNSVLLSKIANRIDDMRQEVAQSMFSPSDDTVIEEGRKLKMAKPRIVIDPEIRKYVGPQSTGQNLPEKLADLAAEDEARAIGALK